MIKLNNVPSEFRPLESYKMLIGGEWVSSTSQKTTKTYSPATGELLSEYQSGSAEDVERAVSAARNAFKTWSKTSPAERQTLLLKIAYRL